MNDRMYHEINEIIGGVEGDIIDFRVYKGMTFSYLVKIAAQHGRHAVGMDTFYGLETPTKSDWNQQNQLAYPRGYAKSAPELVHQTINKVCGQKAPYELHGGSLDNVLEELKERKYSLALIDMLQYEPTKKVITYVYDKMSPGGVMYFLNYHKNSNCLSAKAVDEFLNEYAHDVFVYPPIYYNDNLLTVCRVAVKQHENAQNVISMPQKSKSKTSKTKNSLGKEKINIALVLRTGGDTYNYKYVNALAENIRRHTKTKFTLSCLTDNDTGIDPNLVDETIPFRHNYRGWWSKIELFRPEVFTGDRVFYMDLDTVVVNNIDEMLQFKTTFAGIRDLYHHNFMQTGIMSWNPNYNHQVYENFVPRAGHIMMNYPEGDAKWIRENVYNYDYLQDNFSGRIVSYKAHCLNKVTGQVSIPSEASIICFHGRPRPHTIVNPLITEHWSYR